MTGLLFCRLDKGMYKKKGLTNALKGHSYQIPKELASLKSPFCESNNTHIRSLSHNKKEVVYNK